VTGSRLKLLSIALVAALAALVLLAWSQQWFELILAPVADPTVLQVGGDVAAAALPPLAFASFALVLALAIAGPVFRVILGVLEALLGLTVVVTSTVALSDPVAASAAALTEHTGVTGFDSLNDLVTSATVSGWPYLAIVSGALMIVLGVLIAATGRRWPTSGRKYTRAQRTAVDATSPVDEWDALSEGDDPTQPGPHGQG
jgi:uncharacterized membrane protein (TIGR02234 family)